MEVEYMKKEKKSSGMFKKLRSYISMKKGKSAKPGSSQVAPTGCFSVYVGPEKQRFVMKTEYANHPLFKMLLEDAESEYGFANDGPLHLPCDVDLFCRALAEMDNDDVEGFGEDYDHHRCGFVGYESCSCSPFHPVLGLGRCGRRGAYDPLTPSRMLRINHF